MMRPTEEVDERRYPDLVGYSQLNWNVEHQGRNAQTPQVCE